MFAVLGKLDKKQWDDLFEFDGNVTLGAGGTTLSAIMQSNFVDGREVLREAARRRARDTGAQVIVMGHTHQPDVQIWERVTYYNPGSWTRYLDLATVPNVTLDMLKDELGYPYELNVVRVERIDEVLHSSLICVDRFPGKLL
jgi:predicted phosphodiesterase